MSRGTSTGVLFLVLVALGAYIFFVERKREPVDPDAKPKVFAGLQAEAIEELVVTGSKGDKTTLRKQDGTWRLVAPIEAEADAVEVSAISSGLASLEQQRVVEESAADLSGFGLAPPRFEVAFRAAGDAEPRLVQFGEKTPTGGDMYAKLGDGARVFLVPAYLDTTFDRGTFELRDKSVLKLDRQAVDGMQVVSGATAVRLARRDGQWRVTAPLDVRADQGAVESLIGRVSTAQMKAIVEQEAVDLAKYGLEAPEFTVHLDAGSARSTLLVGTASPEGSRYAKDASRPMVFTIDGTIADDLRKEPSDFRPKDLFEFRSFTGQRFEATRDGLTLVFEKQKGEGENAVEKWVQAQPAKDVEEGKIIDLLSTASNLRAASFVDALPPNASPLVAFKAVSADGKREEVVTFHKAGEDVYATRAGDPGAAKLFSGDLDSTLKNLDALK
jgi:hypothetical protein